MKKTYETPAAEKITFSYAQQVVASGKPPISEWTRTVQNCSGIVKRKYTCYE